MWIRDAVTPEVASRYSNLCIGIKFLMGYALENYNINLFLLHLLIIKLIFTFLLMKSVAIVMIGFIRSDFRILIFNQPVFPLQYVFLTFIARRWKWIRNVNVSIFWKRIKFVWHIFVPVIPCFIHWYLLVTAFTFSRKRPPAYFSLNFSPNCNYHFRACMTLPHIL